jgi:hypothetical protein
MHKVQEESNILIALFVRLCVCQGPNSGFQDFDG